ncbi:MAG TPA: hypothetical protein VNB67_04720 [Nitrososphaeraceae archaeon]|nr:hypothetical protein [Nitrososphaeraceae archaeon]
MSEIGLVEIFNMGEAVALIGTLFVILYFSRKQAQSLSVDIETKVLNDLAERMHTQVKILMERPQLTKVLNKVDAESPELTYAYDILFTFAHAFHMRQRKVLNDNEWTGWVRWYKSAFKQGTLMEIWQKTIEMEKWFDPAFHDFINREIVSVTR